MEDVVAVMVTLDSGEHRYFMTWGRIQDVIDGAELAALVLREAPRFDLGGEPASAEVCWSLRDARHETYFFEALLAFAQRPIPYGSGYEAWRAEKAVAMARGEELRYLGRPRPTPA